MTNNVHFRWTPQGAVLQRKSNCKIVKGFDSKYALNPDKEQRQIATAHPRGGSWLVLLMLVLMSPLAVFMSEGQFLFDCPDIPAAGY